MERRSLQNVTHPSKCTTRCWKSIQRNTSSATTPLFFKNLSCRNLVTLETPLTLMRSSTAAMFPHQELIHMRAFFSATCAAPMACQSNLPAQLLLLLRITSMDGSEQKNTLLPESRASTLVCTRHNASTQTWLNMTRLAEASCTVRDPTTLGGKTLWMSCCLKLLVTPGPINLELWCCWKQTSI